SGEPGTRLACGMRRGRPASVSRPTEGSAARSAADQPASAAASDQDGGSRVSGVWPTNQADCACEKISRSSSAAAGAEGGDGANCCVGGGGGGGANCCVGGAS